MLVTWDALPCAMSHDRGVRVGLHHVPLVHGTRTTNWRLRWLGLFGGNRPRFAQFGESPLHNDHAVERCVCANQTRVDVKLVAADEPCPRALLNRPGKELPE